MPFVELVAALTILQFLIFGVYTGKARERSGLKAPAMTGDEGFERMYRVQMNTLEVMVAFLPALFLAAQHWPAYVVAPLGVAYLIGRHLYWRAYVASPSKRGLGFMLSIIPTGLLVLMALLGAILAVFRVMA